MSQEEVYKFLVKNNGKAYSVREMSEQLEISVSSVGTSCARLFKSQEIERYHEKGYNKETKKPFSRFLYFVR